MAGIEVVNCFSVVSSSVFSSVSQLDMGSNLKYKLLNVENDWDGEVDCCCCCCSPSETYGRKWGDSNFQILTELPVPPQATGVVGTFNVLYIYLYIFIILSTTVSHF